MRDELTEEEHRNASDLLVQLAEELRAKVLSLDTALWSKDQALKESEERVAGLEYRVKVLTAEANELRASLFSANENRTKRIEEHEKELKLQGNKRVMLEAEIGRLTSELSVANGVAAEFKRAVLSRDEAAAARDRAVRAEREERRQETESKVMKLVEAHVHEMNVERASHAKTKEELKQGKDTNLGKSVELVNARNREYELTTQLAAAKAASATPVHDARIAAAIKEELIEARIEIVKLSSRVNELKSENDALLATITSYKKENTTLRKEKQARSEDSEKVRLTGEVGRLTYELEHARQGCRTRQADLDTAQGRVVLLGREVTDLRDELAKMTQYLDNERKVLCDTKRRLAAAETDAAGANRSVANLQDQLAHEMQEVVRLKKLGGREDVFKVAALAKQCSRLEEALAQTIADLKCEREERASESKSVRASVGRINELQGILEDVSRKLTKESIRLCDASPPLGDRAAT